MVSCLQAMDKCHVKSPLLNHGPLAHIYIYIWVRGYHCWSYPPPCLLRPGLLNACTPGIYMYMYTCQCWTHPWGKQQGICSAQIAPLHNRYSLVSSVQLDVRLHNGALNITTHYSSVMDSPYSIKLD